MIVRGDVLLVERSKMNDEREAALAVEAMAAGHVVLMLNDDAWWTVVAVRNLETPLQVLSARRRMIVSNTLQRRRT